MTLRGPAPSRPRAPGGRYVVMIRYAPGIWDFHPDVNAEFPSLEEAEAAAALVPPTLETRIYKSHGGQLLRFR